MPPARGARRGTTARGGRNARRGRNTRVGDEVSQHGEHAGTQENRQGEEVHQPGERNPSDTLIDNLVTALAARVAQAPRANTENRAMEVVREFRKLNPPVFDGRNGDPLAADHWLSEIRKLFDVLDVKEDAMRVRLVACQLGGEANEWWKSILTARRTSRELTRVTGNVTEPDVESMTWAEFEAIFEDQYFPDSIKEELREQFEQVGQGAMTVTDYAMRFQALSRFAPELVMTEERKCRRFIRGLNEPNRRLVISGGHTSFSAALEIARSLEASSGTRPSVRPGASLGTQMGNFRGAYGNQGGHSRKRHGEPLQFSRDRSIVRAPVPVSIGGSVSRPLGNCYQCGQPGHIRAHCPSVRALPPPQSRVQGAPGTCFGCGGFGHIAKYCPQRGGNRGGSSSGRQTRPSSGLGGSSQRGAHPQIHYRQTTSGPSSQVDGGASSSTPAQTTRGRVFAVAATLPPPPSTS